MKQLCCWVNTSQGHLVPQLQTSPEDMWEEMKEMSFPTGPAKGWAVQWMSVSFRVPPSPAFRSMWSWWGPVVQPNSILAHRSAAHTPTCSDEGLGGRVDLRTHMATATELLSVRLDWNLGSPQIEAAMWPWETWAWLQWREAEIKHLKTEAAMFCWHHLKSNNLVWNSSSLSAF